MKTVAIFDDDVYIGNMIEEALQAEGYAVVRAYSGTEVLLLLKNSKPGWYCVLISGQSDILAKFRFISNISYTNVTFWEKRHI